MTDSAFGALYPDLEDAEAARVTCTCGHNVEDHVPDDFEPSRPCPVDGCRCNAFEAQADHEDSAS